LSPDLFPESRRHQAAPPLFSTMMTIQFFVVLFIFPETKGLSLEEVPQYL
jgi:hypothetical protein